MENSGEACLPHFGVIEDVDEIRGMLLHSAGPSPTPESAVTTQSGRSADTQKPELVRPGARIRDAPGKDGADDG